MNKIERKPLSRITFTGLVLLFVIFAVIISLAVIKHKRPAVAEVLSSEPIIATVTVRHEYCDLTTMPGPYKRELLDIVHPTELVCTPYLLYETLMHAPKVYGGPTYRSCTVAYTYEPRIVGYDVVYRINDTVGKVRINYNPGDAMPVDNSGRLIILPGLKSVK